MATPEELQKAIDNAAESMKNLVRSNIPGATANFEQTPVAKALKEKVAIELAKDTATKESLEKVIIDTVNATIKREAAPADDAKEEVKKAYAERKAKEDAGLAKAAGTMAENLVVLKESQGPDAVKKFEEKMDAAAPALPISNPTLIGGGAAATLALVSGDSLGDWTSFKGIAIKLGIIAAGLGVGAYISGDYKYLTMPAKPKDESKAPTP